eukprot:c29285_g5_i1 orf=581-838(-)
MPTHGMLNHHPPYKEPTTVRVKFCRGGSVGCNPLAIYKSTNLINISIQNKSNPHCILYKHQNQSKVLSSHFRHTNKGILQQAKAN